MSVKGKLWFPVNTNVTGFTSQQTGERMTVDTALSSVLYLQYIRACLPRVSAKANVSSASVKDSVLFKHYTK